MTDYKTMTTPALEQLRLSTMDSQVQALCDLAIQWHADTEAWQVDYANYFVRGIGSNPGSPPPPPPGI